jgi:hypothetical protein
MTDHVSKLTQDAMALPFDERVALIEAVMVSLDADSLDGVWSQEMRQRLIAYRIGGIEAQDFGDYLKKYEVK